MARNIDEMLARDEDDRYAQEKAANRFVAYPDPLTKGEPYTIGRGHTGPEVHAGLVWDAAQEEFAYQLDKASAWQACVDHFPWFGHLNDARQAVLWSMMFQMGPTRVLKFRDTLDAVRDERYAHAAECMRQSVWARQTPKRVIRLAYQLEMGEWQ
jgi:lysozyme